MQRLESHKSKEHRPLDQPGAEIRAKPRDVVRTQHQQAQGDRIVQIQEIDERKAHECEIKEAQEKLKRRPKRYIYFYLFLLFFTNTNTPPSFYTKDS